MKKMSKLGGERLDLYLSIRLQTEQARTIL